MKNIKQASAVTVVLLCLLIYSCQNSHEKAPEGQAAAGQTTKDSTESKTAKEEMNPPIAEDVVVQPIEGDAAHVLLLARFDRKVFSERALTIHTDDQEVVLHDDGTAGDSKADDGVFSVKVEGSVSELKSVAVSNLKSGRSLQGFHFEGRHIVRDNAEEAQLKKSMSVGLLDAKSISISRIQPLLIPPPPANINDNCLMIRDVKVVEDPSRTWNPCKQKGAVDGVWTFARLMREMASPDPAHIANDAQLSEFVMKWLNTWNANQAINGFTVSARPQVKSRIIDPWLAKSQAAGAPAGRLDMRFAPFRLMAIVNRLDLRGNSGYGFSNAGEGRFVFCLIDQASCSAQQFNVIFEYGINKKKCADVQAFGSQWLALSGLALGSASYDSLLQVVTDQFTRCGTNSTKPGQSSLNQLRTNEIALASPWQLREFNLRGSPTSLQPVTVKKEPDSLFNDIINNDASRKPGNANINQLAAFINGNKAAVINSTYNLPAGMEGGAAETPSTSYFWDGTKTAGSGFVTSDSARESFSLNTCSGCHGGEPRTAGFTMIHPAGFGVEAVRADFLTGLNMPVHDPAGRPKDWTYNDLLRRAIDLMKLVHTPCGGIIRIHDILTFRPVNMTH